MNMFKVDFLRDFTVTIDGVTYASPGRMASKQEQEAAFGRACDAFVRFVTGDKNAKYATASRDVKVQAAVLMGFSSQGISGVNITAFGVSFSEDQSRSRLSFTGPDRVNTIKLSKDENGNIQFNFALRSTGNLTLTMEDEFGRGQIRQDPSGSGGYSLKMTLDKGKFSKFAKTDWDHVDKKRIETANEIAREQKPGWVKQVAEALPEDGRLEVDDLELSYDLEVNEMKPLEGR